MTRMLAATTIALMVLAGCDALPQQADEGECRWSFECPGKGGMDVRLVLEDGCDPDGNCTTRELDKDHTFLGVIPPDGKCRRPSECETGAVPDALRGEGWDIGRWKVIAPVLEGLIQPEPVLVEVRQSKLTPVTLTYRFNR